MTRRTHRIEVVCTARLVSNFIPQAATYGIYVTSGRREFTIQGLQRGTVEPLLTLSHTVEQGDTEARRETATQALQSELAKLWINCSYMEREVLESVLGHGTISICGTDLTVDRSSIEAQINSMLSATPRYGQRVAYQYPGRQLGKLGI